MCLHTTIAHCEHLNLGRDHKQSECRLGLDHHNKYQFNKNHKTRIRKTPKCGQLSPAVVEMWNLNLPSLLPK